MGKGFRKAEMNKKQLIILWTTIIIISLILLFPEHRSRIGYIEGRELWQARWSIPITRPKLVALAVITSMGLIVTFRGKEK